VPTFEHAGERLSEIEIVHPRHACSRKNFVGGEGGVLETAEPWSHDAAALAAAKALRQEPERQAAKPAGSGKTSPAVPDVIDLESLAEFMHDPLWPYVRKTLGINTWREDDLSTPATLPLELERLDKKRLLDDYIKQLLKAGDEQARKALEQSWAAAVTANGDVPILGFGDAAVAEITQFSAALLELANKKGTPLDAGESKDVALSLDGVMLTGTIERCYPSAANVETIVLVRPDASSSQGRPFQKAKVLAVLLLLAARAQKHAVQKVLVLNQHEDWFPGATRKKGEPQPAAQDRTIRLAATIDTVRARELLTELCSLYRRASVAPHATFDKTDTFLATDRETARDTFVGFLRGERYAKTLEAVVHGAQPDFDEVFPEDSSPIEFFTRLRRLKTFEGRYVYTP